MFRDRKDGGLQLARALEKYRSKDIIVLGIPHGGAVTGYYVAKVLNADFSLLIARKLGLPDNPETAVGALAEDGSLYLDYRAARFLSEEVIKDLIDKEQAEIGRRIEKFRMGKSLPAVKGRTAVLVDDGIATGATVFAGIEMCRKLGAEKVVVAAPIAGSDTIRQLQEHADEVVILDIPDQYWAVSQGYRTFYNLFDEDVLKVMQKWESEKESEVIRKS